MVRQKGTKQQSKISIHAPPRGATAPKLSSARSYEISIHAPPRGATAFLRLPQVLQGFQFTPLREGRRRYKRRYARQRRISIHAPPRGATVLKPPLRAWRRYFNSRPSARGDPASPSIRTASRRISIHAPPRGATRRETHNRATRTLFQFTPLREGRLLPKLVRN